MRFFVSIVLGIFLFGPIAEGATTPSGSQLLTSINATRSDRNLSVLKDSFTLRRAAVKRADDMVRFQYFSHTSLTGRTYRSWLVNAPVSFSTTGENIARGQGSTAAVMAGWLASGSHKKNLLNQRYTHVGTAVRKIRLNGRTSYLYVAVFGRTSK